MTDHDDVIELDTMPPWFRVVPGLPTLLRKRPRWDWSAGSGLGCATRSGTCATEAEAWQEAEAAARAIKAREDASRLAYRERESRTRYLT